MERRACSSLTIVLPGGRCGLGHPCTLISCLLNPRRKCHCPENESWTAMTMLTPAHMALHTLARLNQVVSSSLDMDKVLREIAHAAATLMDAPCVHFFIADEATHMLESRAFSAPQLREDFPRKMVPFSQGGWAG